MRIHMAPWWVDGDYVGEAQEINSRGRATSLQIERPTCLTFEIIATRAKRRDNKMAD